MLNYIKSRLSEMHPDAPAIQDESVDNSAILEYASMFSELSELSEDGHSEGSVRKPFDIPIEDDIELSSIEINYSDGRVLDVPTDATVSESYREMTTVMKTRDDFVQEAYSAVTKLPRESHDRYMNRVNRYVSEKWNAYQEYVMSKGLFGYDKMKLNDSRVPDKVMLEFDGYSFTLPVRWEIDRGKNVTKKQLDSLTFWANASDARSEMVTEYAVDVISEAYRVNPNSIDFGGSMTPVSVIVPKGPTDSFAIIVEFDTEYDRKNQFMMFAAPVKGGFVQEADKPSMETIKTKIHTEKPPKIRKGDKKIDRSEVPLDIRRKAGVDDEDDPRTLILTLEEDGTDGADVGDVDFEQEDYDLSNMNKVKVSGDVKNARMNMDNKRAKAVAKSDPIYLNGETYHIEEIPESKVPKHILKAQQAGYKYDAERDCYIDPKTGKRVKLEYCTLVDVSGMNVARKRDFDLLVAEMSRPSRFGNRDLDRLFQEEEDGTDVGGVDFEQEGSRSAQRMERKRASQGATAIQNATGVDRHTAKQLDADIHDSRHHHRETSLDESRGRDLLESDGKQGPVRVSKRDFAGSKTVRDLSGTKLGQEILSAQGSSYTPSYVGSMTDSRVRSKQREQKLLDDKRAKEKFVKSISDDSSPAMQATKKSVEQEIPKLRGDWYRTLDHTTGMIRSKNSALDANPELDKTWIRVEDDAKNRAKLKSEYYTFGDDDTYMEGIDFGGGGDPPAPVEDTQPDTSTDTGTTSPAPTEEPAPNPDDTEKVSVAVNDVSDQIAQNVSDQTQADANTSDDLDINVDLGDGETDVSTSVDVDNGDVDPNAIDSEIDALDAAGTDAMDTTPTDDTMNDVPMSTEDIDNMSIDDLIAAGAEKLKHMTLGELKNFINAPDGTSPEDVQEAYVMMEAFSTKSENVRKRIDSSLQDVKRGLKKILMGFNEDEWNREDFKAFWYGEDVKINDDDDFGFGEKETKHKHYFSSDVGLLLHYLKIAAQKKRARDAFNDNQRQKIEKFRVDLKQYEIMCNTYASKSKSYDVSTDDLIQLTEKILGYCEQIQSTISAKSFLENYIFEAAVITKRNIKAQIAVHIKSALGILNNTDMNFKELVAAFTKEGKNLNKVLTKASKMKKIFTTKQLQEIDKLNSILIELQSNMRMNGLNTAYTNKVKALIKDFANQCKVVGESLGGGAIQEACSMCQSSTPSKAPTTVKEEDDMSYSQNDEVDAVDEGTIETGRGEVSTDSPQSSDDK